MLPIVRIQSYEQWLIVVFIIIASLLYVIQIEEFYRESKNLKQERGQYILEKTKSSLDTLIYELQRDTILLSQSNRQQIIELISEPDNIDRYDLLVDNIKELYPNVFSVTVADNSGKAIVEDFDGYIQQTCIDDISYFSSTHKHPELYIHPNPYLYHFDMMTELSIEDKSYIFFVSFDANLISNVLNNNETPGYKLILINKDIDNLIELVESGPRNVINGDIYITDDEKQRKISEVDIPGTKWSLIILDEDRNNIGEIKLSPKSHFWPIVIFNIICIIAVIFLQLMKKRIYKQNVLIDEKSKELLISEEHLMAMFTGMLDGMVTIDINGTITEFNPAAENMFGYTTNEVLGKNVKMLLPEEARVEFDNFIDVYKKTDHSDIIGSTNKIVGCRKNGELFPVELSVNDVKYHDEVEFIGVVRDITDRTQVEKMKNEFISTVSHEMRTPLTSIRGSLGLIAGGAMGELGPDIKNLIEISINNTERLIRMINDILDIDRIESGNIQLQFDDLFLKDVALESINNIEGLANEKNITIDFHSVCDDCKIHADKDRIIQAIVNILSNAIKFSGENDTVLVILDCNDDYCNLSIKDTGIGISENHHEAIFDKFTQVDSSDTREIGGSGLGLSIVKSIISAHHGSVELESQQGTGSTFIIHMPR
jgi:PAS domain S-box-containing protein